MRPNLIDSAAHPSCLDRTARLVWSHNQAPPSGVFKVSGGYMATIGTLAFAGLYDTEQSAQVAILEWFKR